MIFISAGEASGDAYGAEIVRAVGSSTCHAVGSKRLQAAGAQIVVDSTEFGAVGIANALIKAPQAARGYYRAKDFLRKNKGVFVPIDFGFFNIRLCRIAKQHGWKVLYFVPPGSWRRDRQGQDLPLLTDEIVTPFRWSAELLNQSGASAHWFGHPLVSMIGEIPSVARSGLALLPGSRWHEIEFAIPLAIKVMNQLGIKSATVARAPTISEPKLRNLWEKHGGPELWISDDRYDLLKRSHVALVTSGTATTEACLCECPSVVIYGGSSLLRAQGKLMGRPKFIAQPNIILNKPVLPELVFDEATLDAVSQTLAELLPDESSARKTQLELFQELRQELGGTECFLQTARLIGQIQEKS